MGLEPEPLFQAWSYFRRRKFRQCSDLCSQLLEGPPGEQVVGAGLGGRREERRRCRSAAGRGPSSQRPGRASIPALLLYLLQPPRGPVWPAVSGQGRAGPRHAWRGGGRGERPGSAFSPSALRLPCSRRRPAQECRVFLIRSLVVPPAPAAKRRGIVQQAPCAAGTEAMTVVGSQNSPQEEF